MGIAYVGGVCSMDIKTESKRINVKLPRYVQDWYKEQGKRYNVPYTNYITFLLVQFCEKKRR